MPSIEQCETASGSVAALPSTLEIFDKFKSVSENGKDSDSEESFHLPLDDDDMENQSVESNGRDKETHNEETEDDILNKFEVVPSGTPDNIDPHIEDSILDDVDSTAVKEGTSKVTKKKNCVNSKTERVDKPLNGDVEKDGKIVEKPEDKDADEKDKKQSKVQVNITCDFGEYEDSADGEFKSVYETDEPSKETVDKESKIEEDDTPVEAVEPMEVTDELETIDCDDQDSTDASPRKVEAVVDNFEDSMEVDTNQDIANIIEKLEDQDTPMEDVASTNQKDEGDVNMTVSDDVEMTPDSQMNIKENKDEKGCDESTNETKTFQESTEASKDTSEKSVGETEIQVSVNNEEVDPGMELSSDCEKKAEEEGDSEVIEERRESDKSETSENPIEDKDIAESESTEELSKDKADDITESKSKNNADAETGDSDESPKAVEADDLKEEKQTETNKTDLQDDALLKELEQTINESDDSKQSEAEEKQSNQSVESTNITSTEPEADEKQSKKSDESANNTPTESTIDESQSEKSDESAVNNSKIEPDEKQSAQLDESAIEVSKESENNDTQLKLLSDKDEEVFKAPVELPKEPLSSQRDDLDAQNDKSNDKTDEDESDLLDVSMVRETDEDDACAIADALNGLSSEKSDEEQSEKVETEQESSDVDKDNEDNDNDALEFDDIDEDSHMESVDQDDSSNAESAKGKIIQISESSKDSVGESEPKRAKKAADVDSDASNDVTEEDAGEEMENMDVSSSIIPNKSVNLNATSTEDDTNLSISEKESSATVIPNDTEVQSGKVAVLKKNKTSDNDKTENDSEKSKETSKPRVMDKKDSVIALPEESKSEDMPERRKVSLNKRSLSPSNLTEDEISAKKPKLAPSSVSEAQAQKENVDKSAIPNKEPAEKDPIKDTTVVNDKIKTLTEFSKFMQCRKFTAKLSRSDLEQFCIQKICESLMLRSSEGELHQTIKKHEKTIEFLRKDMQQLTKQCKDLEIVNKKLMNELRSQNALKKPLVPLKITRSVGLQVRLNPGNEAANQSRRRLPPAAATPQKQTVANSPVARAKTLNATSTQQPTVVRQVLQNSPQKSPLTTGQTTTTTTTTTSSNTATPPNQLLSQALQQSKARPAQVVAKRTATPVRKQPETPKPSNAGSGNPGVIDLTDEDDRLAANKTVAVPKAVIASKAVTVPKTVGGSTIKIMNKTASPVATQNKNVGKMLPGKTAINQGKQIQKTVQVGTNKGNLSQGIRLTSASVITSSANGSPQMVYVVPTITSNSGGTQKVAFVNFQPTNGVISGTLNGSPVSVMSNKGQTLTLKTVPSIMRQKHPAPLPPPPRTNIDPKLKPLLPKPLLTIKKIDTGIILQWKMPYNLDQYENIASYQLYAYQETSAPPNTDMWRKVGDVKALALPMACTLTQFADKNKYYFAVRSVDVHKRIGAFSEPEEISL